MTVKSIHVIACGRDWEVKAEGEAAPFYSAEDKGPVVDYARKLAKEFRAELIVHDPEGKVEYKEDKDGGSARIIYMVPGQPYNEAKAEYGDGPGEAPGESRA